MSDPALVLARDLPGGLEFVINFGVFSGREATAAEIYRLGEALLDDFEQVEVIAEQRYEFDRDTEATVYQLRVELPAEAVSRREDLLEQVEAWARDCIAERSLLSP
jgi:hypothetical protein